MAIKVAFYVSDKYVIRVKSGHVQCAEVVAVAESWEWAGRIADALQRIDAAPSREED